MYNLSISTTFNFFIYFYFNYPIVSCYFWQINTWFPPKTNYKTSPDMSDMFESKAVDLVDGVSRGQMVLNPSRKTFCSV